MIDDSKIKESIRLLNEKYDQADISVMEAELYCKLALLEYCGWLEDTMDIIANNVSSLLTTNEAKTSLAKRIKENNSCSYHAFKELLTYAVGVVRMEQIELALDSNLAVLQGLLSHTEKRNTFAHTHTTGATDQRISPSVINGFVKKILPIFNHIDRLVRATLSEA